MGKFARPEVVISRCLGFESCRYNAQTVPSNFVSTLGNFVNYTTVCPEVEIGLGIPRAPIRLIALGGVIRLIQPSTGLDVTEKMNAYASSFLSSLENVDGFILKALSPSCGIKDVKVYPGAGKVMATGKDSGIFGGEVIARFGYLPIEDEGRLTNFALREHFLTTLFTVARFRELKMNRSIKGLVDFQSDNKLLFMSYNQNEMRTMGRIAGNLEKKDLNEVFDRYEPHFYRAMSTPPKHTSHINVLMHGLGYFSRYLSSSEKKFFLDSLERYRQAKIPMSVPLHILKSYVVAFENDYLARQTFFEPYPEELVEISDSGKGRASK